MNLLLPNKAEAPNPEMALLFHISHRRRVGGLRR